MPVRRISREVLLYIAIALAQLVAALIISGSGAGISVPGVVLAVILLSYLYLGQPVAWWVLVVLDSVALIGLVAGLIAHLISGDHIIWGNELVLLLSTAALELVLLSPGMRLHIASRGLRLSRR